MGALPEPAVNQERGLLHLDGRAGLLELALDRADDLDHADLLLAGFGQHDVEGTLLLRRRRVAAAACRSGCRDRRCRRHAPLLFDLVLQLDELQDGHLPELAEDGVDTAGHTYSSSLAASEAVASSAG